MHRHIGIGPACNAHKSLDNQQIKLKLAQMSTVFAAIRQQIDKEASKKAKLY